MILYFMFLYGVECMFVKDENIFIKCVVICLEFCNVVVVMSFIVFGNEFCNVFFTYAFWNFFFFM